MRVVEWSDGRLASSDSVVVERSLTGAELRDAYSEALPVLTLGLVRLRGNSVVIGPIELLRFGPSHVTRSAVEWPIAGGLLARQAGGKWRVHAFGGRVEATVTGYVPSLPRFIYALSHKHVHLLFTRLFLLRLRGREPAIGDRPTGRGRFQAASVDLAFCLTLSRMTGRTRLGRTLAVTAAYHVACWTVLGRTLGGMVLRQRVVAVDGSRLTATQSMLRLALVPPSWALQRPLHDEIPGTDVISD